MSKPVVLVTGSTGNTGKEVANHLLQNFQDKVQVRVQVRSKDKGADFEKQGAEVAVFDWTNSVDLEAALKGVERLWLTGPNPQKNDQPFDRINLAKKVVDAAKKVGVKFIALGSVLGSEYEAITFGKEFRELEKYIEASGIQWSFLRMGAFTENALGSKGAFEHGVYPQPLGKTGSFAPITTNDIGLAAATVLAHPDPHVGKAYALTGPEVLTGEQQAAAVSRVLGKAIQYVDAAKADFAKAIEPYFATYQVQGMLELYNLFETGGAAFVSKDFETITGKVGTKFEDRLRQLHQWGAL